MARIKLSDAERLKRKTERRARKKAERAANKLVKKSGKKAKGKRVKETEREAKPDKNIIEVLLTDKVARKKMTDKVENGKARVRGYNMGSMMYELIK